VQPPMPQAPAPAAPAGGASGATPFPSAGGGTSGPNPSR
jgi:hypothetical protein